MSLNIIIIDDNDKLEEDALIWELKGKHGGENIKFISDPATGLQFIKDNLDKNTIVLLDIQFPANGLDGHKLLSEIRNMSELIPVILWSGIDENKEAFSDFINNHAFGFISKTATSEEAMKIIDKAEEFFKTNLDNSIEDWIIAKDEDKDKPIFITSDGQAYSLNQILHEIRIQSEIGKTFSRRLNELTIDLLLRKKENLNG